MTAIILSPTPEHLALTAQAIQRNEVVGMPTETVYGLAGNARSPQALTRIFQTKERPTFDPLIVHVGIDATGIEELSKLKLIDRSQISHPLAETVNSLIHHFWPGPLTLVLPKHPDVPDLATSGLPSVALRMPAHPVAQALIEAAHTPLAAPSANRFGRISPTTPAAVAEELGDRIDWILDGGPSQIGVESTVLAFSPGGDLILLRPGGTPLEKIEQVMGQRPLSPTLTPSKGLLGPGMLESHYAPRKRLHLLPCRVKELKSEDLEQVRPLLTGLPPQSPLGLLLQEGDPSPSGRVFSQKLGYPIVAQSLSRSGNLEEAAHNLFEEMRKLDSSPALILLAEPCLGEWGLSHAIRDRLKRASAQRAEDQSEKI